MALKAALKAKGRKLKCPKCGSDLVVPSPEMPGTTGAEPGRGPRARGPG